MGGEQNAQLELMCVLGLTGNCQAVFPKDGAILLPSAVCMRGPSLTTWQLKMSLLFWSFANLIRDHGTWLFEVFPLDYQRGN